MQPQRRHTDFAVYDRLGRPLLWVEVKRIWGLAINVATEYRHWYLENTREQAPFLLVTPDNGFLWAANASDTSYPQETLDMQRELAVYFERTGIHISKVRHQPFEMIVAWWLGDLLDRVHLPVEFSRIGLGSLSGGQIFQERAS
ncbi:MAG: hypothetical protein MUF64_23740 [Polyangiaceae bacterium]|jgi:hypothetical protein|nr:hypothetical protein [Polyangiaceae bacterium]